MADSCAGHNAVGKDEIVTTKSASARPSFLCGRYEHCESATRAFRDQFHATAMTPNQKKTIRRRNKSSYRPLTCALSFSSQRSVPLNFLQKICEGNCAH